MKEILAAISLIIMFQACSLEPKVQAPDVSDIKAEVDIKRFDQALNSAEGENPEADYVNLLSKYPRMTDLYFKSLVQLHDNDDKVFYKSLAEFLQDERITSLADTVSDIYPELGSVEKELQKGLQYLKHYFPDSKIPNFYSVFTEFGYPSFIFEDEETDAIGIGLDMFLGEDFGYKKINPQDPAFSDYMTRTYNKDHIAKKSIEMLVVDKLGDPPGKRFIDQMLHHGKRLYLLDKVLPHVSDTVVFEYTPAQLEWAENNQKQMWDYFLENNLIYETNHLKIAKLLQPAPSTAGMPDESPGRTGTYMGYKIVEAYMNRYPENSLRDLVNMKDSQKFLEQSRYKPKRT